MPNTSPSAPPAVQTILGQVSLETLGITDAHNHLWIDPVPGAAADSPVLNCWEAILVELEAYRQAGGGTILDCQPGGCGRNGQRLAELARTSRVNIVACTGFHRQRYYPPAYWLWQASAETAATSFVEELTFGLAETLQAVQPVRAGFIKIACEASLANTPQAALEGAAAAAAQSGAVLEIHTEKGQDAEAILSYFVGRGVSARQVVLCHIDKRPDFGLHRALVQAGVLLEYDTFYRPKYAPQTHVWPLIEQMVTAGLDSSLALATDMAESSLWRSLGGEPGLVGLINSIRPGLVHLGIGPSAVERLTGGNIARRLAGLV
jgi:predicted metal-dependent phosphotriesterase family hydrolase